MRLSEQGVGFGAKQTERVWAVNGIERKGDEKRMGKGVSGSSGFRV